MESECLHTDNKTFWQPSQCNAISVLFSTAQTRDCQTADCNENVKYLHKHEQCQELIVQVIQMLGIFDIGVPYNCAHKQIM